MNPKILARCRRTPERFERFIISSENLSNSETRRVQAERTKTLNRILNIIKNIEKDVCDCKFRPEALQNYVKTTINQALNSHLVPVREEIMILQKRIWQITFMETPFNTFKLEERIKEVTPICLKPVIQDIEDQLKTLITETRRNVTDIMSGFDKLVHTMRKKQRTTRLHLKLSKMVLVQ